jgi:hypothetical protein
MKMKLFATLAVLAVAAGAQAAEISVDNITVAPGTPTVDVPILISPSSAGEMIGAMNISFSAGSLADAIPFVDIGGMTFDNTIWDLGGSFFGEAGTLTPRTHSVLGAVAMVSPLQVGAGPGIVATYRLNTAGLAGGTYELNPNFQVMGVGSSADTALTFTSGSLVIIPEPTTVAMTAVFALLGLGVFVKRRRG